jgi:hypothetical protein
MTFGIGNVKGLITTLLIFLLYHSFSSRVLQAYLKDSVGEALGICMHYRGCYRDDNINHSLFHAHVRRLAYFTFPYICPLWVPCMCENQCSKWAGICWYMTTEVLFVPEFHAGTYILYLFIFLHFSDGIFVFRF